MSSEKTIYAVKVYAKGREIRSKARDFPGLFWAIFYAEEATPKGGRAYLTKQEGEAAEPRLVSKLKKDRDGFATWSAGTVSG